jgi:hypothetical protein
LKKLLLGTSAIALAGALATPANAAEWDLAITGYMERHIAFGSSDNDNISGDYDGIDSKSDSEIHFSPSITLDNGIKFGARIELEGATASDQIDENYAYISGSFGRFAIGEDDNAAYIMGYSAPDVTFVNVNSGSDSLWLPFAAAYGTTTTFISVEGDSAGIRYFTPRMAGFQLGVSYARDANRSTDDSQKDTDTQLSDIFGIGANYVNSFGDFDIAMSGGYTTGSLDSLSTSASPGLFAGPVSGEFATIHEYDCDGEGAFDPSSSDVIIDSCTASSSTSGKDPEAWSVALNLGFSGFTVGASYADFNKAAGGMETWDVGVSYATGPWGVSFTYLRSDLDSNAGDIDKYLLGMDYKVAKGVRIGAFGIYEQADSKSNDEDWDGDGFVIGTGIKLNF